MFLLLFVVFCSLCLLFTLFSCGCGCDLLSLLSFAAVALCRSGLFCGMFGARCTLVYCA